MNHTTITPEQQDMSTVIHSKKISLLKVLLIFIVTGSILFGIATWIGYKYFWFQPAYESVDDYQFQTAFNNAKEFPGNAVLRVELGWNYMRMGNFEQAKKEFKNALKIDETNAGAKINLAMVFTEEENFEEAKKLLDEVLDKTPALPDAHLTLGQVYLQSKEYDEAIDKFDYLLKSHPGTVDYMYLIGQAYEGKGDKAKAKEFYEQVLSYVPDYDKATKSLQQLEKNEVQNK